MVYLAEYVQQSWWVRLVRDRTDDHLRRELLQTPGVMLVTVPWQVSGLEHRGSVEGGVAKGGGDRSSAPTQDREARADGR